MSADANYDPLMRSESPPPQKRKTCRRENVPGHAHALTFTCFKGQPFFAAPRTCEWMLAAIDRCRGAHALDVWAYVIMPNHVHLLIHPTQGEYSISRILSSLKQPVSKKAILYVRQQVPEKLPLLTGGLRRIKAPEPTLRALPA